MIFITLGSQKFQFNRLLKEVDNLIETSELSNEVYAQVGYSDYIPEHYEFKQFMDRDEYSRFLNESDVVITHGGTGAIIGAVKRGKRVIAVPRMEKYNEHVDNHQEQIVKQFSDLNLICGCFDVNDLKMCLDKINKSNFESYCSNTQNIIDNIEEYLQKLRLKK